MRGMDGRSRDNSRDKDEFARRAKDLYERRIREEVEADGANDGRFVAIDVQSGDYEVLEYPELLFGSQNVLMTVSADKLERVGRDRFLRVVDAVNRRLTQAVIVQMNAEVTAGQDEGDVAKRFLRQAGLLRSIGSDGG